MELMDYEILVRRAFALHGFENTRWGDPANLASAGYIQTFPNEAKAAATYSMGIFKKALEDRSLMAEYNLAENYIDAMANAATTAQMLDIIRKFLDDIVIKHFS